MSSSSPSPSSYLTTSGCMIKVVPGRGMGIYADRFIARGTLVEIGPVCLFEKEEYENHRKHTVLDHYTFVWPDGRMALAQGLGSIFNHADSPNVSFTLDSSPESIRYTTSRNIQPGEELCIFYGHERWFSPSEGSSSIKKQFSPEDLEDARSGIEGGDEYISSPNPFEGGDPDEIIGDEALPFTRFKPPPKEETPESIRTVDAWVVDVPEPRHLGSLIKWLKHAKLESPDVAHLKRIRKNRETGATSLLLTLDLKTPPLPNNLDLPEPYRMPVPASSALTLASLTLKTAIWPTMYTPKRKDEPEPWTRGRARWAWDSMLTAVNEAITASTTLAELPIAAHIAAPYGSDDGSEKLSFVAHDTRRSTNHPLRHAAINAIRKLADYHANKSFSTHSENSGDYSPHQPDAPSPHQEEEEEGDEGSGSGQNGSNYLLTGQTVFLTHEPCIMCSMALLHSRATEIFYLYPMPRTGGCGSLACLPTLKGVNHRFSICRWDDFKNLGFDTNTLHVGTDVDA